MSATTEEGVGHLEGSANIKITKGCWVKGKGLMVKLLRPLQSVKAGDACLRCDSAPFIGEALGYGLSVRRRMKDHSANPNPSTQTGRLSPHSETNPDSRGRTREVLPSIDLTEDGFRSASTQSYVTTLAFLSFHKRRLSPKWINSV
ncbi:unnamed protein product [Lota lota]